jgi:ZIP family zinc transporter
MNPTGATVFGFSFIFLMTSLGSAIVFFFRKRINQTLECAIFAFAAGVMISAAFWSLLVPAVTEAEEQNLSYPSWVPCLVGFILGCGFIQLLDFVVPLCIKPEPSKTKEDDEAEQENEVEQTEEVNESELMVDEERNERLARAFKMFLAITVHNIPEGVACGLVFGHALKKEGEDRTKAITAAVGLAVGIGVQDFPEGAAVSLPIREISGSTWRGFIYGVLSGLVEPIAASLALAIANILEMIDPWTLAFSGGAMLYVTVQELIPEAMRTKRPAISMWLFVAGFSLMMLGDFVL